MQEKEETALLSGIFSTIEKRALKDKPLLDLIHLYIKVKDAKEKMTPTECLSEMKLGLSDIMRHFETTDKPQPEPELLMLLASPNKPEIPEEQPERQENSEKPEKKVKKPVIKLSKRQIMLDTNVAS